MVNLKIDKEFKDLIPPLSDDEFKQLEKNIKAEGWRNNEAIVLWNGILLDGHNRHKICTKNKIRFKTINKKFKTKDDALTWVIDNQLGRRNLSDYSRILLESKKANILEIRNKAKEQQVRKPESVSRVTRETEPIETAKVIAKKIGISKDKVYRAQFLDKKVDKETEKKLILGEETIHHAYTKFTKEKKRDDFIKDAKKKEKEIKLPEDKKYNIIYADPPWKYFEGGHKNQSQHYSTMDIEKIKNLPIQNLAEDNCILFMWATWPILKEALKVIESWGFEYSTAGFVWIKKNKKSNTPFFGCGAWTRANSEFCLIATKGSVPRQSASVSQIIDTPIEGHSKKPDCVRDKIVELVGDLPRIELFARNKTKGWDTWGNEVK